MHRLVVPALVLGALVVPGSATAAGGGCGPVSAGPENLLVRAGQMYLTNTNCTTGRKVIVQCVAHGQCSVGGASWSCKARFKPEGRCVSGSKVIRWKWAYTN